MPTQSTTTNIAEMETAQERGHGQAALCYGDRGENIKKGEARTDLLLN